MKTQAPEYIVDANGRKKAVLLPVKVYERMQQDLHDLAVVAERRKEKAVSSADFMKQLKRGGLV